MIDNFKNNYSSYILKIMLLLVLLTPLIYSANLLDGVVFTKVIFFTSLVELTFIIYLIEIFKGKCRFRLTWLDWSVLGFLAILILSAIFSQNVFISFWGTSSRSLNLFVWLHLFLYYLMVRGVFQKFSDIRILLRTSLIIGGLVSVYVLLQTLFDWQWLIPDLSDRVTGPLGNPIFTGDFLALIAILSWGMSWIAKRFSWRTWYIVIFILSTIAVYILQARGPILALVIGWIIISFGVIWQNANKTAKWLSGLLILMFIVIGVSAWAHRNSNFVQSIPVVNKFTSISLSDPTTQTRLSTWNIATKAFFKEPVLGYGLVNFEKAFQDNYIPVFEQFGTSATKFDAAHSFIFEYLSTTGILGLLSYLLIFISAFWMIKIIWKKAGKNKRILILTIGGIVTAYLTANLTSIEHLATASLLFTVLAVVAALSAKPNSLRINKNLNIGQLLIIFLLTISVAYSFIQYHIRPVLANQHMYKAEFLASQKKFNQSLILAKTAVSLNTFNRPNLVMEFAFQTDNNVAYAEDVDAAANYLLGSAEMLKEYTVSYYRDCVTTYRVLGSIYNKLAIKSGEDEYLSEANIFFEKAVELSPNGALIWMEWGKAFLSTDKYHEAINKFDKAIDLNNGFGEARVLNSIAKLYSGDFNGAQSHLDWVLQNRSAELRSSKYVGLIVDAYYKSHKLREASQFLASILKLYPDEDTTRGLLAVLYKEMGRIADARTEAEYILKNSKDIQSLRAARIFLDSI